MSTIISVENLSKRYTIGTHQSAHSSVREAIMGFLKQPDPAASRNGDEEVLWALKDVSFNIDQGELVGIVGQNGAGKSTLLKVLSQITEPTSGRVRLYGRIGSLLEVGTGFHHELTGRENIFLNGSIIGMKRAEIQRKFDEIVAFAEVEKFLDTPVKRYSSGMYMRLAFAVAVHLEPDILLVDEVLAVGDVEFQRRCLAKMHDVVNQGRTVLLVSHNMLSVSSLCTRTMWISDGEIQQIGPTEEVISKYLMRKSPLRGRYNRVIVDDSGRIRMRSVRILDSQGQTSETVDAQQPFYLEIEYEVLQEIKEIWFGFVLSSLSGVQVLAAADGDIDAYATSTRMPGVYSSTCEFPANLFNAGSYVVSAYAARTLTSGSSEMLMFLEHVLTFDIEHPGGIGSYMPKVRHGVICPKLGWDVKPVLPDALSVSVPIGQGMPAFDPSGRESPHDSTTP